VVFAPVPSPWFNTNTNEVITGTTRVELNNGSFVVDLTPTDEPGVNPASGRLWRMTELIPGALPRTVRFELPAGDTPVDVTDLPIVEE